MDRLSPFRFSAAMRLVVLFTLFFFFLLIAGGVGAALGMVSGLSLKTVYLLSSVVQNILAFCVPAWFAAKFSSRDACRFLGLKSFPGWRPFVGVVIVFCLALPCMNQIISWNENMHLPEWASGFEKTLRELEETNAGVAEVMLKLHSVWQMLLTVAVVGVLTGFSEELFFRGALQRIFLDSGTMIWIAVWMTALIFSFMHFQFFGFFPRVLMGAFFGYLFVWSGSLWPAVFAHFLNNSIVVVGMWITDGDPESNIDNFGVASYGEFPLAAFGSCIATALFLWGFRNYFFKMKNNG